ncbi:MAG: alpha/beta fold hydrolase [Bauldia sp.]
MRKLTVGLAVILGLILVLAAGGAIFQSVASASDRDRFPPPGMLVDVGSHSLHIHCFGAGTPTVILDHAGGSNSAQWALVMPEVAATTRVCAYDRAGFGWSEPGEAPFDASRAADELGSLLANAREAGPYVMVGHSYGGFVSRLFADRHLEDVLGLVLVDPGRPLGHPLTPSEIDAAWRTEDDMIFMLAPFASRLGMMRLAGAAATELPSSAADAFSAMNQTVAFWDTVAMVHDAMGETSALIVALGAPVQPVIVLSAGVPDEEPRRVWTRLNASLASGGGGEHRVIEGVGHMDLVLTRAGAAQVTDAIVDMVAQVRGRAGGG